MKLLALRLLLTLLIFPPRSHAQQRDYGIQGEATFAVDIAHVPTSSGINTFKFEATSKYVEVRRWSNDSNKWEANELRWDVPFGWTISSAKAQLWDSLPFQRTMLVLLNNGYDAATDKLY